MRIRFRFSKLGKVRFTSQRDVARMWERALRRAALPLAYTEGFSPRPQLGFGLALPTGCESLAEYVDVLVDEARAEAETIDVPVLSDRLSGLLPEGIDVHRAVVVDRRATSLQQEVSACSWAMSFRGLPHQVMEDRVSALLAAPSVIITRERKGRQEQDDLRPSVLSMAVVAGGGDNDVVELVMDLATRPRGVRPVEVVRGLRAVAGHGGPAAGDEDVVPVLDRACRTQQWIERDGARWEPVELRADHPGTERAVHALERAS